MLNCQIKLREDENRPIFYFVVAIDLKLGDPETSPGRGGGPQWGEEDSSPTTIWDGEVGCRRHYPHLLSHYWAINVNAVMYRNAVNQVW